MQQAAQVACSKQDWCHFNAASSIVAMQHATSSIGVKQHADRLVIPNVNKK
jgi:hypothetical protein